MDDELYRKRLSKINEDEEAGKITAEEAASKRKKLKIDKEAADQEEENKKRRAQEENNDSDQEETQEEQEEEEENSEEKQEDDEQNQEKQNDEQQEDNDKKDDNSEENTSDGNKEDTNTDIDNAENERTEQQKVDNNSVDDTNSKKSDSTQRTKESSNNSSAKSSQETQTPEKRSFSKQSGQGLNTGAEAQSASSAGGASTSSAGATQTASSAAQTSKAGAAGAKGGGGGGGGGPLKFIGSAIVCVLIALAIVATIFFFLTMPGTVVGKIGSAIVEMRKAFEMTFLGDNAAAIMVDREDVNNAAQYLEEMGYDLAGFGFLDDEVQQIASAAKSKNFFKLIEDWRTSDDATASKYLALKLFSTAYVEHRSDDGEEYVGIYLAKKFGTLVNTDEETIKENILMVKSKEGEVLFSKSKYLAMYLTAENATYLIRNYNTNIINRLEKLFGYSNETDEGSGMIRFYNASEINANKYIANLSDSIKLANAEGFAGYDRVQVSRSQRLLKIKNDWDGGWFFKQTYYTYDLDSYVLRYGFPLQLSLALHLSTMAPDFAYEIAERAAFDTKVNMGLLETKDNNVAIRIKLDLDEDGIYENYSLQSIILPRIHKDSSEAEEVIEGYDNIDDAIKESIKYLEEDEELTEEEYLEMAEEEKLTEEQALEKLETEIKSAAEAAGGKIPITFYYSKEITGNSYDSFETIAEQMKLVDGDYNTAIQETTLQEIEPFIIDINNEYLTKITKFLMNYDFIEYIEEEKRIVIKEENTDKATLNTVKDLFNTYFKNSDFSQYYSEEKQNGTNYIIPEFPENTDELENGNLEQYGLSEPNTANEIYTLTAGEWYKAVYHYEPDNIFKEYELDGESMYCSLLKFYDDYQPIVFWESKNENSAYRDFMLLNNIPHNISTGTSASVVGYLKATTDEIWRWYFEGEELTIQDKTDREIIDYIVEGLTKHFPVRTYYRLIDENGNVVTFEEENNKANDFVYADVLGMNANAANTYYCNANDIEGAGWFWRNAIPKKFANAIIKAIYGLTDLEEIEEEAKEEANNIYKLLNSMKSTNTEGFTKYLPFITSVTDHWYEDLDFSGCYEWIETDEPMVYIYDYDAVEADSQLVKDAAEKGLLSIKETTTGKLVQIAEPHVSGTPGDFIRNLIDNKEYTIYNGVGASEEKRKISFTDAAIDVIAMLEQINGESSQQIIRMFKELLASYNIVFEESEDTKLKKILFREIIDTYSDVENNLFTEGDDCVFYARMGVHDDGFESDLNVKAPTDSRVVYVSDDSVCLEIIAQNGEYYDGYTILISGFDVDRENITLNKEITKGTVFGKTKKQDIRLVLRDADGAIVKNSYTMLSDTNFENFARIFKDTSDIKSNNNYRLVAKEGSYVYESAENNIEGFAEGIELVVPIDGKIIEKTNNSITIKNQTADDSGYTNYTVTISGINVSSSLSVNQEVSINDDLGTTSTENIVIVLKDANGEIIENNE